MLSLIEKRQKKEIKEILLNPKKDRRVLPYVPDSEHIRTNTDRRGVDSQEINKQGLRYENEYKVDVLLTKNKKKKKMDSFYTQDISSTGLLLKVKNQKDLKDLEEADTIKAKFKISPGTMPEGFESTIHIEGEVARIGENEEGLFCGIKFKESLAEYLARKKGRYTLAFSSSILFFITWIVVLMRAESVIYFRFNRNLYLYSIIAAIFLLSRYFVGVFYRPKAINSEFTPGVTVIIPCFNEEEWIHQTIISAMNQDYPIDQLEVIVVDDCSNDASVKRIQETMEMLYKEGERFKTKERLSLIVQERNRGKRDALAVGTQKAKHPLVVFVDSDSFLDPFAIKNLVQPFQDSKVGGVSGRTDVANTYTNALTKMQSVRYYIAFRIMKAAESYFDAVTCLSGPLACYRKDIVLENMDTWLNQKFLGQRATFGDDRSLTNLVLKKYRTVYQDTAICQTIVPNRYKVFLKQQMRWKRSWLRESIIAAKFMWKKEPFAAVFFFIGLVVPIAAPGVVLYNFVYVPITYRVFPTTFLIGILMMASLMSFAQMFLRKSTTWVYGMFFCFYYEAVLLWQMPVAWVTFWKSTWGTRMTPEDLKENEKKVLKKEEKKHLKTVKREKLKKIKRKGDQNEKHNIFPE